MIRALWSGSNLLDSYWFLSVEFATDYVNLNLESIDVTNEKISPWEQNLWSEMEFTAGTRFKKPFRGGIPLLVRYSTHEILRS